MASATTSREHSFWRYYRALRFDRLREAGAGYRQHHRRRDEGRRHRQPRRLARHLQSRRSARPRGRPANPPVLRRHGHRHGHGPHGACEVLRECLYRGADRAILINDRRAAASDTLATCYILSRPSAKSPATTSSSAAARPSTATPPRSGRNWPKNWASRRSPISKSSSTSPAQTGRFRRNVGNGWEILEARLPVLITVIDTANDPRPPAARRLMQFKRRPQPRRNRQSGRQGSSPGRRRPKADRNRQSDRGPEQVRPR